MRIGIDARFYGTSGKGLGRYVEKLIEHLEKIDTQNEYIIFLLRENFGEYRVKNPRFTKVVAEYRWYGFSEQIFFPLLLWKHRLDLVHFPHFNVPFLYGGKFVVTIHDLILLHYPTLRNTTRSAIFYWMKFVAYRFVIASAIRRAHHIIAVSLFTERDILLHYPRATGKTSVTYEAADSLCSFLAVSDERELFGRIGLIRDQSEKNVRPGSVHDILESYFLYVGNAYPHKNLEALLGAAEAFPDYRFVFVGKDDYFYARLKREAKGKANVIFTGFLTDQELNSLYRYATLYLFPSLYEGFGLPPLEAMTRGLPVVSSDRGSLPEILGEAVCYFDPEKEGGLEDAIGELIAHPEEREMLRRRGYERAGRFRWEIMATETLGVYTQCIPVENRGL